MKLPQSFYRRDDVVRIGRELLGKVLCTRFSGQTTAALITETEAYAGSSDRASHAYGNRRTKRTEPLFAAGGIAYVYLCYGIHHLFNVVTNEADVPHAVLIRAAAPLQGIDIMLYRRSRSEADKALLAGPGSTAQALGIDTVHSGISLSGSQIWIEDRNTVVKPGSIVAGPRVGVDYAAEDASLPYRFILKQ